jgi:hypothetical protein
MRSILDQRVPAAAGDAAKLPMKSVCNSLLTKRIELVHFIHSRHETEIGSPANPHDIRGCQSNRLIFLHKTGRAIFNRKTKNAFKKPTYGSFAQTVHTVIHKDCGQFLGAR